MQSLVHRTLPTSSLTCFAPCKGMGHPSRTSTQEVACSGRKMTRCEANPARSFYYFDPENPENVVEVQGSRQSTSATSATAVADKPYGRAVAVQAAALQTDVLGQESDSMSIELQQQLSVQLELERKRVLQLQQYEGMYKEWRVRAEHLAGESESLERELLEKDAELSGVYRKLEVSAAERVALRQENLNLKEETKRIRGALEEAKKRLAASKERMQLPASSRTEKSS